MKFFTRLLCALSILVLTTVLVMGQEAPQSVKDQFTRETHAKPLQEPDRWHRLFKVSVLTYTVSGIGDIATTRRALDRGAIEANPFGFSVAKAVAFKSGLFALTYLAYRKHHSKAAAVANFIISGLQFGAVGLCP